MRRVDQGSYGTGVGRLVYYSLSFPENEPRPDLIWQLDVSVASLRTHNPDVPVALFVHGAMPPELAAVCHARAVMVYDQGPYPRRLASRCPTGWRALARYPLLHKFLNFRELAGMNLTQILFCDCDTVFRGDVHRLFDAYGGPHVVAREEVHSRRSPYGADHSFVDECLLERLAHAERASVVPPFNLGVVLFNHGVWQHLAALDALLIDYAWRFVTWMAQHPASGHAAEYGEFRGLDDAARAVGPSDRARALPFPSSNRWLLDEAALWLTLGHLPGLTTGDFHPDDVAQNGEFGRSDPATARWIVCHYYSQNIGRIDSWLRRGSSLNHR